MASKKVITLGNLGVVIEKIKGDFASKEDLQRLVNELEQVVVDLDEITQEVDNIVLQDANTATDEEVLNLFNDILADDTGENLPTETT